MRATPERLKNKEVLKRAEVKKSIMLGLRKATEEKKTITIECSSDAAESLISILEELKRMGDVGASREIVIRDWKSKKGLGFDGDGWAKIHSITIR